MLDKIPVQICKHRWARRMRLTVSAQEIVKLTLPIYIPYFAGTFFIKEQADWIRKTLSAVPAVEPAIKPSKPELKNLKKAARLKITGLVEHYALLYQVNYRRIAIKDQKTLWGSCSRHGNLNFNWRITLAPEEIQRYVIVHELCHLKEMNHSARFWALVAQAIPDYKTCRKWLKTEGKSLL
jgi:predicted metal-dependent hydrolase